MNSVASGLSADGGAGPAIIIHGGAGAFKVDEENMLYCRTGAINAVKLGYAVLERGGSALDAVEIAVRALEDFPYFNAGTGACLTSAGTVEHDAFIMEGLNRKIGAVASVRGLKNPVSTARLVMDKTKHCLLVGEAAVLLAKDNGINTVPESSLLTELSQRRFEAAKLDHQCRLETVVKVHGHDTVGAAAVDKEGHVAAATSTGGITYKMPGRVGDSPLAGCGGWADDKLGAVSTTGYGEAIMRSCLAFSWASAQRNISKPSTCEVAGEQALKAACQVLEEMEDRIPIVGRAGLIAVTPLGGVVHAFNTEHMAWAYIRHNDPAGKVVHCGIRPGEDYQEAFSN